MFTQSGELQPVAHVQIKEEVKVAPQAQEVPNSFQSLEKTSGMLQKAATGATIPNGPQSNMELINQLNDHVVLICLGSISISFLVITSIFLWHKKNKQKKLGNILLDEAEYFDRYSMRNDAPVIE